MEVIYVVEFLKTVVWCTHDAVQMQSFLYQYVDKAKIYPGEDSWIIVLSSLPLLHTCVPLCRFFKEVVLCVPLLELAILVLPFSSKFEVDVLVVEVEEPR